MTPSLVVNEQELDVSKSRMEIISSDPTWIIAGAPVQIE
jgi:hypothetical protein